MLVITRVGYSDSEDNNDGKQVNPSTEFKIKLIECPL